MRQAKQQQNDTNKETFWSAARDIIRECHTILKPGGIAVWVTKDYIKASKRVPFSADWARLCEACGFRVIRWAHAMLVKETRHGDLFDGESIKVTERKSFFRRLAEKRGSPKLDWEDVIFVQKVGEGGRVEAVISSPPFHESLSSGETASDMKERWGNSKLGGSWGQEYGNSDGQLGNLPAGSLADMLVSSPPFGEAQSGGGLAKPDAIYQGDGHCFGINHGYQNQGVSEGQLSALPVGDVAAVIGSPPFADSLESKDRKFQENARPGRSNQFSDYGSTTGQLGTMQSGSIDFVISSPPYAAIASGAGGLNTLPTVRDGQQTGRSPASASQTADQRYGKSEGQLSRMVDGSVQALVGSPPFAGIVATQDPNFLTLGEQGKKIPSKSNLADYGSTTGQLGAMAAGQSSSVPVATMPQPVDIEQWHDCYAETHNGNITVESFTHPAKMSRSLVKRIFDELFKMGAVKAGDVVVDPFGGIGVTLLEAASQGLMAYGIELEPKFVGLGQANIDIHTPAWKLCNCPIPVILQGDSRKLRDVISKHLVETTVD